MSGDFYAVELGKTGGPALDPEDFSMTEPRFLSMKIDTTELKPRMKLGVVPNALNALRLDGKPAASFAVKTEVTTALNTLKTELQTKIDALTPAKVGAEPANANIQTHLAARNNPHDVTPAQLGLEQVENTRLSTWSGSASITSIGTLAVGSVPTARLTGALVDGTSADTLHLHAKLANGSKNAVLDTDGTLTVSGAIRVGGLAACTTANIGAIRHNGRQFEG